MNEGLIARAAFALLLALGIAACGRADEPLTSPIAFDTARAWIHPNGDSIELLVEVARTDTQKRRGLMGRSSLDPGSGMIFLYDGVQAGDRGFWMWRTEIPLDIAFLDADGAVAAILAMEPCESPNPEWCPTYPPGVEYGSALEVNRGWFERHGVGLGARVEIDFGEGEDP
jgi:uncharacterized protein